MKNLLLLLALAFVTFSCRAQAVYQLSVLPVCWSYANNADSTLYAYWLMSSRQEEPRLMSYLNVAGQVVSVSPGTLSPGPCCCDGAGNIDSLSIGVVQDSIVVLYNAGVEISRDTVYFAPGEPVTLDTCSISRVVEVYDPTWTARAATEASGWNSITFGNGLFVAVANTGTNRVMTSPDGINWTVRAAAEASNWNGIIFGNGLFVAVANSGTNRVMTSPDGINWTARAAAEANTWKRLTFGNGLFVAVADSGTNRVMTSPDGINWTARAAAEASSWNGITFGNGLFVAVANTGTNRVMTSPDGINWTARTSTLTTWKDVTFGNGLFVAVADVGTNRVMTSPDGITWTVRAATEANSWRNIGFGNGLFVATSGNGTNRVMTSPDGITWTARAAAEANVWFDVDFGNGLFVAVSSSGTNRVMTSGFVEELLCPENPYGGDNTMQGIIDSLYANINVIATNGLNDADPTSSVDVELGGILERNTVVTGNDYTYGMRWDSLAIHEIYTGNALGEVYERILGNGYYNYRLNDSILQRIEMSYTAGQERVIIQNRNTNTNASSLFNLNTPEEALVNVSTAELNNSIGFRVKSVPGEARLDILTPGVDAGIVDTGYVLTLVELTTGKAEYRPIPSGGGGSGPTYTAGGGIAISGGNVISATDNSATNEIQALSLSGNTLALSNGGGTVDLTAYNNSSVTANLGLGTATATTRQITSSIGTPATLPSATTSLAGLMAATDKTKLDGLTPGGTNLATTNLTQSEANRTYTYTGTLGFIGGAGSSLLLQATTINLGRAGQAQTASIPTLSPEGAGMTNDANGFMRVLNHDGTLPGTGYRGIGELFNLITRDQFAMRSVGSSAITTTRYNSATPLALTGVPTSLKSGYAYQSGLLNRGFVGLNQFDVTALTSNGDVLVESPTEAMMKSSFSTVTTTPAGIQMNVNSAGVITITGVDDYPDQSSASGLAAGTLYTINGALYIAQ